MRFQARLPVTYCGDCILTTIPFCVLFRKAPSYAHLRVFGYQLLSRILKEPVINLALFTQKGYKLLNMITKRYFLSRHVKFLDVVFLFLQQQQTAYMKLDLAKIGSIQTVQKFWVLNTIFLIWIRNKSNLKNPQNFGSNPTRTHICPLDSNITSLLFIFFNFFPLNNNIYSLYRII